MFLYKIGSELIQFNKIEYSSQVTYMTKDNINIFCTFILFSINSQFRTVKNDEYCWNEVR